MNLQVYKFGGASIKDADAFRNVASIIKKYPKRKLVIVVSAMGKVTNALEGVVKAYFSDRISSINLAKDLRTTHELLVYELFKVDPKLKVYEGEAAKMMDALNEIFVQLDWILEEDPEDGYDYVYDQVVSIGEMLSSTILSGYLNSLGMLNHWLDIRDVLRTNDRYREAIVDWDETSHKCKEIILPALNIQNILVTQGFIGSTSDNQTTTLGREGSDYTASILSHCLDVDEMTIWKDVPGILTGDPTLFETVTKLDRLSYREAIEMTYYGAKVIHPKTIKPIQNKNIPLRVMSFLHPEESGTFIGDDLAAVYPPVVVIEHHQTLIHISTKDFSFVAEHHLANLFGLFSKYRIKVNMMKNSAISFSVCTTDIEGRIESLIDILDDEYNISIEKGLELITVRHYNDLTVAELIKGKIVLMTERLHDTIQLVVKQSPPMIRKA